MMKIYNQQTPTQQAPYTVSTIKLLILKKGEYDIWAMKIEHYLSHTDYPIWEVIQKGNGPVNVLTDTNGVIKVLPPKTVEEILARERERKARTTLLMALLEDHLAKFHKMTNAKEMWDAIKSGFGGNDESKKMQKYILKQQFEGFSISNSEELHKGYDRSLPSSWSHVSLVMRTKPGVDSLSFDDLYNNLRVFESNVKGSTGSSSSIQNVTFVSFESTSSTNDVSTAYGVSTSSGYNSQRENSSSYTNELMYSFFANHSIGPQLDHEDLEQLDEFDLEEMDLKWQVAMILMRVKKFYKRTGRRLQFDAKEPVGFDKTKFECFNCHKTGHFTRECRSKGNLECRRRDAGNNGYRAKDNGRRPRKQEEPKALVTLDGEGVDWTGHTEDEQENFALMADSNSGLDIEVTSCLKECVESYAKLKKLYDEQREQLGDASIQLVAHQKNQLWYKKKIRFMKIDLDDKTDMSERDKSGLGSSDVEDSPVHDRFANVEGMHAVPPLMTGNYMPSRPDREIDDSMFTYGPKQSKTSESNTQTSNFDSCESNSSTETLESMPEPVVVEPNVVSQPKVWPDAPIIEEYESDSDDEYVIQPSKEQERPSFAFIPMETVKEQKTYSLSPKANKRDWNGLMSKRLGLGYRFTKKACFLCGSFSHLIKDCDFHEKRIAKQVELNKKKGKGTGQGENRPLILLATIATTSTARKVNTARPIVNEIRPRNIFYKSHSPIRRPFNRTTTPKAKFSNQKVNTAEVKVFSAVGGKRETAVKPSAGCNWRPKRHYWYKFSKYNGGSNSRKCDNPQKALKNKGIVDSGCSRHMTDNKAYFLVSAASWINTARPKLSTARLGWCCSKVFHNGKVGAARHKVSAARKGVKFSRKVTPLFNSMLMPHQAPKGEDSRDSLEGTNRSEGDQGSCWKASKELRLAKIIKLKTRIKKLKKKSHPVILHHQAWLRSVSRLSMKRKLGRKEYVSTQGRKNAKPIPTLDDSTFDDLDAHHGIDYMDTEEPVIEGRLRVSTVVPEVSTVGVSTAVPEVSTATPMTPPTTTSVFEDEDIFLDDALVMLSDKTKLKGVAIKEVKEFDRPERSILTLKPLPSIDPKDKGKGVLKESPVKKVKRSALDAAQIAKDAETEQASVDYIANLYDEVQAKMDASEELAARLQMEGKMMYTVEERSRLLAEYFKNRKKQLAAERSAAIRNKPPARTQLRSLMIDMPMHTDSDLKEEEQLKSFLMIVLDVEGEIDYEALDKRCPIVEWESKFYHTDRYGKPHDYYRVFRADRSSRYIKTFTEMVSRFDRLDFIELHSLVMKRFETSTPEGIDLILWGSLRTMFEANAEDDLWKNQEEWILKSWNFYDKLMLALRLIVESESEAVFDLLRFIQKQIDESGSHDGSEKDL
ncbi:putative ribonuclease H-like domain-containing protein [Tanacetum coccineum]